MALNLLPNNAMTFTENQHGTAVLEKLRSQRELMRCCDVILHVAGNQFQAHRCVLAACSPYFDSIFKAGKTVKEQLTITSQDPEVFRCLLAYMYTGTVVVDKTNVAELLRLANRLLIAKLKEHCAEYLERYLDASNCLTVRDMATKYNLKALEKTTGNFIQTHLSEIVEGDEVLEMSLTRLEDFLRSPSWHLHEDQTLLLVTRWVHHCPKSRERNLRSLLTWVQWSHLNPETPIHLIRTHPLYTSSSHLALFFLFDALNEHSLLPPYFLTTFSNLKAKFSQSTDSAVDNESFFSLAISTAIDELQEDQLGVGRGQEAVPSVTDFSSHVGPSLHSAQGLHLDTDDPTIPTNLTILSQLHKTNDFHTSSRRDNDDQDSEHCNQYDLCRIIHSSQDVHGNPPTLVYSQPVLSGKDITCDSHISEDLLANSGSGEESKFPCNSQGHFGQPLVRNMTVWHQEPSYSAEESLSSDSSHMYQRQVYDQNFSMKTSCAEPFNSRMNASNGYTVRETPHKNKQGFASAVSYYVSTYNPDDDTTVSDDQSTQSFPYDENFNPGINFYSCRSSDVKENQHLIIESHHNQENYPKSYYQDELATTQDVSCSQPDVYYNENSTDTQMSNCPQDMTIQHQMSESAEVKDLPQNPETEVVSNSSDNARINSFSERLITEDQHYDHYPLKTTFIESKYHRDSNRSMEEHVLSIGPRDMVSQEFVVEGKRLVSECDLETRGIINVVGGTLEGDRTYKGCSLDSEGERSYKETHSLDGKDLAENEPQGNVKDSLPLSIEVTPPERQQTHITQAIENTPRQVKFKIKRSCSQGISGFPSSTSDVLAVTSEAPLLSNTPVTEIEDEIKMNTREADLDDNHDMLDGGVENLSKKELKEEQSITDKKSEDTISTAGEEQENLVPSIKEGLKRVCRKEKIAIKNNGGSKGAASTSERVCEVCEASFLQTKYYTHMREHFPGPPHTCDTCEASFKRIYHLLEHRITHQDTKVHKCPHCPFSAHKKFNLTEHLTQHSKTRNYKCKLCGDSFFRIQNLLLHETKHTSERPFLCESCGWSGKTKNSLIVHTKKHTGELLRCQYSQCTYATAKRSHLKEHMLHHSNSRPFICEECGHSFGTNSHLRRHVKLHLPEKPFKCSQCDYSSPRQDRLKIHIRKKHTPKESASVKTRKKLNKRKHQDRNSDKSQAVVANTITAHIECSQADIFSDLENTNISLQPQLSGTPPPTTLSEYPPSPSYTFPSQSAPEDSLIIVSDMATVTEGFTPLNQAYEGSYHSPQYQTSPSHFAALSPTQTTLSYSSGHHHEENPLNFAACMKYD
ncbi:uncharacterized protein LOC127009179 isoform X2 [Eriocheir sinensis]|uniref:uncharacterized protein LOC127009179 isoform X2 n=1 Tax=Eriocheir sinensis TaxID=95602 RepID=UPI0021C89FEB|nr:uncharacterized protein LOC127009179 isoform X2 [Eriocheir sinensis]